MLIWGEADSETSPKRSLRRKIFKTCCMNWGEVNPTHAYYNGSCTSKNTEDPSWSTSFKTRRTQKTSSALEDFICVVFVPDRNIGFAAALAVLITGASQSRQHGSGYHQKDRKPSQNDKTEHGMEKTVQNQGQSPKMPKSESILKNQQSNRSRN
ncbi:hypothetical protein Tco_0419373 [Tanacetum coccineum]